MGKNQEAHRIIASVATAVIASVPAGQEAGGGAKASELQKRRGKGFAWRCKLMSHKFEGSQQSACTQSSAR